MGVPQRLVIALALLPLVGCVLPEKFVSHGQSHEAVGGICQVVSTWDGKVRMVPDPTQNGKPAPGIAGRIYLFGELPDFPRQGDGALFIEMYDDSHGGCKLEEWRFDPTTFQRLAKKDTIGMGYTVFLPWGTCRHDIKQVRLTVRYEPANGSPLFAPPSPLTLDHSGG